MKKNFFEISKIPIIENPKGNLYKLISKNHSFFDKFGELYITEVFKNQFKGWKHYKDRSQILTVLNGRVKFYLKKKINDKPIVVDIEFPNKMKLLKIYPNTFYSFKCFSKKKSTVINLINQIVK